MRRTAKECGEARTAASRQTSAFEMVSPSAKTAERILLLPCEKFEFVSFAVGIYFGLKGFRAGCGGRTPQAPGLLPPRPPFQGFDARRAATTRRFAHWGGRRGDAPMTPPHAPPGLAAVQKVGRGAVLPHLSRGLQGCRKIGEGKLRASFPSPLKKARGVGRDAIVPRAVLPTIFQSLSEAYSQGSGWMRREKTSAFEMVSPPAKTAERILVLPCEKFEFVSFAGGIYFGVGGFCAGCGGRTPQTSGLLPPTPSTPRLDARRAATTRRFAHWGGRRGDAPMTPPHAPPGGVEI